MKSIMITIKPQFVAKILNGEKTIEIKKTMPKCDLPIDVYIYCTKDKKYANLINRGGFLTGMVVAKFTLNNVEEILIKPNGNYYTNTLSNNKLLTQSCLSQKEIFEYTNAHISKIGGYWFTGYAIHISDLEIFDKPKELSEFKANKKYWCDKCPYQYGICLPKCEELKPLTKAPKSYQFIESEK